MDFGLVKLNNDKELRVPFRAGEALYVLGANGSGKSTLLYSWAKEHASAVLIAGNREVVFSSSAIAISASQAIAHRQGVQNVIREPRARFLRSVHNNENRLNDLLFALKSRSDDINKRYRQAHRAGKAEELQEKARLRR